MTDKDVSPTTVRVVQGGLVEAYNNVSYVLYDSYADRVVWTDAPREAWVYAKLVEAAQNHRRR